MANSASHASLPYPVKNARYTIPVPYLDADGDPTDPTTPDTEVSKDGGAFADCAEEVTTITGSNGCGYITLTGAETDCSLLIVVAKVASGPKATILTDKPRVLPILESGTAQGGAAGSITLAAGAAAYDLTGCIVRTTGGTGGGGTGGANNQARVITAYNASTKVATISPNWETNPDSTTTYDILLTELAANAVMGRFVRPTTDGRTLTIETDGMAHADLKEWKGSAPANLVDTDKVSASVQHQGLNLAIDMNQGWPSTPNANTVGSALKDADTNLDATVSSRSTLDANGVWTHGTRTLTAFGFSVTVASGGIASSSFAAGAIDANAIAADAIGASELAADAVAEIRDAILDRVLSDTQHATAGSVGARLQALNVIFGQVSDTTPAATNFDTNVTVPADDFYVDQRLRFITGSLAGQSRPIFGCSTTGNNFNFAAEPFTSSPANGDKFVILDDHTHALGAIADAVLDELLAGHTVAGSLGKAVSDTLGAVDTEVASILAAVDTEVAAIKAKTDQLTFTNANKVDAAVLAVADLAAAVAAKIADIVLRRQMANVEASADGDALSVGSMYGAIQMQQESAISGTTLTVKKTDGTTTLGTKTLTTDAAADPITGVS